MLLDVSNVDFRPTYCFTWQIAEAPFGLRIYRSSQTSSQENEKKYYFRKRMYMFVLDISHFVCLKVFTFATLCRKSTRMMCRWSWIFDGRRVLYQVSCRQTQWHALDIIALVMITCKLYWCCCQICSWKQLPIGRHYCAPAAASCDRDKRASKLVLHS